MKRILMVEQKQLKVGDGLMEQRVEIHTPWLRADEAGLYIGGSRSSIYRHLADLPSGHLGRVRLYHCQVLSAALAGGDPFKIHEQLKTTGRCDVPEVDDNSDQQD